MIHFLSLSMHLTVNFSSELVFAKLVKERVLLRAMREFSACTVDSSDLLWYSNIYMTVVQTAFFSQNSSFPLRL